MKQIPLILRATFIGAYIGFIPGLGTGPANWLGYAHAIQSSKDKSGFSKGDVRGVIGAEAANNAARGGELIPTILFGVPGSGSMAVLMMGLIMFGIQPGPEMITQHLGVTFTIVWSLALANVAGAIICLFFARYLARIATVPIHILAPFVLTILIMASYQATRDWGDLLILAGLGIVGWFMKQLGFARPPLLVGFVLGKITERYFWLSVQAYDMAWVLRPWVIVIGVTIIASLIWGLMYQKKQATREGLEGG